MTIETKLSINQEVWVSHGHKPIPCRVVEIKILCGVHSPKPDIWYYLMERRGMYSVKISESDIGKWVFLSEQELNESL